MLPTRPPRQYPCRVAGKLLSDSEPQIGTASVGPWIEPARDQNHSLKVFFRKDGGLLAFSGMACCPRQSDKSHVMQTLVFPMVSA